MSSNKLRAKAELKSAKGMVERRQAVVDSIGQEKSEAEARANYESMVSCLIECEKHHNRIMEMVDSTNSGSALESSALVDWSRKWVLECQQNLVNTWGADFGEVTQFVVSMKEMRGY